MRDCTIAAFRERIDLPRPAADVFAECKVAGADEQAEHDQQQGLWFHGFPTIMLRFVIGISPELSAARRRMGNIGTSIRILLDGKPAAPDSSGMSFSLEGVERGKHWLQALLIDGKGQTLSVSDTV